MKEESLRMSVEEAERELDQLLAETPMNALPADVSREAMYEDPAAEVQKGA